MINVFIEGYCEKEKNIFIGKLEPKIKNNMLNSNKNLIKIINDKDDYLINDLIKDKIDLLVYLDPKNLFEKSKHKRLREYIRYNNHKYALMAFNDLKDLDKIVEKVFKRIQDILDDLNKNEEDKWEELYRIDINEFRTPDDYISYKLKYKRKFINKVLEYADNGKVLEAGCGTGLMAGYLQKLGCQVTVIDLSQKILDLAKEIATDSKVIKPCKKYEKMNFLDLTFKPKTFKVAISNGALEHFSDNDIIKTLKEQMRVADYVMFGIPSTYFTMKEKMLGNERSLHKKEWMKLIETAGGELVEWTDFHYYKLFQRIREYNKWFKPKAFWLFIIKAKEEEIK